MSFERDVNAVFGDKAADLTDHHKDMLRRLWDCGRREGTYHSRGQLTRLFRETELDAEESGPEPPPTRSPFPPDVVELAQSLWRASFEAGKDRGRKRLDVVFTQVIKHLPVNEVIDLDGATSQSGIGDLNIHFRPWVEEAFHQVLQADDLDEALAVAKDHRSRQERRIGLRRASTEPDPREPQRYFCHHCGVQVNMMGMGAHEGTCPRKKVILR